MIYPVADCLPLPKRHVSVAPNQATVTYVRLQDYGLENKPALIVPENDDITIMAGEWPAMTWGDGLVIREADVPRPIWLGEGTISIRSELGCTVHILELPSQ